MTTEFPATEADTLHRFLFENSSVRGELVHLDAAWRAVSDRGDYPAPVRTVLGEALTAVTLLASTIKFEGSIILQARSEGAIRLLVVEARADLSVRGMARWHGEVEALPFSEMMPGGHLVMTVDPGQGKERYQGIVAIEGLTVADSLQAYFDRSEQLPTRLWLTVDDNHAAGLLVQNMPASERKEVTSDTDAWERVVHLADTVKGEELLSLGAREIIHRLFHSELVRLFKPSPLSFRCGCTRERVSTMLRNIGEKELQETFDKKGELSVDCEFCNATFSFDAIDFKQLFAGPTLFASNHTRH